MGKGKIWPPDNSNVQTDRHQNLHRWISRGRLLSCKISSWSDKGFHFYACETSRTKRLRLFCSFFSERELTFVHYMLSYARLSVRLSSVCNVRAPYSAGWNFWQYFFAIWYLGHSLTSTANFTEIASGKPLRNITFLFLLFQLCDV